MTLRAQTLRLGIVIATVVIATIICFQLVWLNKIYRLEQKQFDHAIARAVRSLYDDIGLKINADFNLSQLIETPDSRTFFIRLDSLPTTDSLGSLVRDELENEGVFTNTYVGLYDGRRRAYTDTAFLPSPTAPRVTSLRLPEPAGRHDYLTLFFPFRDQYVLSLMHLWIIASVVLLIVLLLLGFSLYYFYRQKFLNETQRDFVNNFTHEFKTPLSVITLAAEVLEGPNIADKPDKLLRYATVIKEQTVHLQHQIERLLQHAHAESQLLHLNKRPVNLHELVTQAIDNLEPLAAAKNAEVQCALDARHFMLEGDPAYLLIVITNLLENGLKYADQPKLRVSTRNENGSVLLSVKDNGRGIEKRYLDRIFHKFYRVPTGDEAPARGFGLGLAFVKRIVQAHHGRIIVQSIPGVGSEFVVKLQTANNSHHG
ncbi:sensor histidine kinase [Flaviaesturariibacter aridisoli]|uniref:histidine kinase n=1 Tax=Flaviaesturariibacter aridisoli TaxID=2545761 RepID=A0A4R4E5Q6_9BACT|nr:HAMP domain-containing sensor histidine kinase [Flaviaesturariibacter aridisoli]TCZ72985.1 HAMP domain-containing histidine kinase [Flaviaesturariibacter aridisoli]